MAYLKRLVESEIASRLAAAGGVVIEGPKACGKTETARQFSSSEVLLDVDTQAQEAINIDPALILEGKTPRLIDEWQTQPQIWNHIRREIDNRRLPGQFILTGSAIPADDVTRHTGAGRLSRVLMRPLSLYESAHSTGEISLHSVLERRDIASTKIDISLDELVEIIVRGGWPGPLKLSLSLAMRYVRDYLGEIQRVDISRIDGHRKNPQKVGRLLQSLARNIATEAAMAQLVRDVQGSMSGSNKDTIRTYLDALERLMIIENQPAWSPNLRSRTRLRSSPKRHFVDPSLAVAALNATPNKLVKDLNWLGFLFESLVVRDLRIYGQSIDATVHHYRDSEGLEVDAIVEGGNGQWAAFEIKLGVSRIDDAIKNLKRFANKFEPEDRGSLAVITSTGYGYRQEDGIYIVPIGALGP